MTSDYVSVTLQQALDTLIKLQATAPPSTALRLAQVADLLNHLSSENAYLNSLIVEDLPESYRGSGPLITPPSARSPQSVSMKAPPPEPEPEPEPPPPPAPEPPAQVLHAAPRIVYDTNPQQAALFTGMNDAMRPPLIAIRSRAELVQAGMLGAITNDQGAWLQAIQESTDRAFALLETVHEIMVLQKGDAKIEQVNFISTDLLTEGWERIRDRAHQYKHEVTIQAPEVVPLARGDFYQSLIVLSDLLDNAVRYTPPGGQIRMSVDNLGDHVLFSVADTGIGLTAEDLLNVSKPFWRGDHHRLVRQHTGTGLRLALAKEILARQNGELIFSGEPDLGSTFSFTLPIP